MVLAVKLTYILGARCSDGAVIVADRKVGYETGETLYANKTVGEYSQMVWAGAGNRHDFGWFTDQFLAQIGNQTNKYKLKKIALDLIEEGRKKGAITELEMLLGVRSPPENRSELFRFTGLGSEPIDSYSVIGRAEPVGRFLLAEYFNGERPTFKVAVLGTFVIKFIELERLDDSVGLPITLPLSGGFRTYRKTMTNLTVFVKLTTSDRKITLERLLFIRNQSIKLWRIGRTASNYSLWISSSASSSFSS